jgi:WD40 repeat protein
MDDKDLRKAIDKLPNRKVPNKLEVWERIQHDLDKKRKGFWWQVADGSIFMDLTGRNGMRRWATAASVLMALGVGTWLLVENSESEEQKILAAIRKTSAVQPTFEGADVPYNSFEVDAEAGGELALANGTRIRVGKNTFVDKNNQPIKGKVRLQYREFHSGAAIMASGIPMTYDSGGVTHQFESAGMFEMRGFKGTNPVFIANGKSVEVDMASFVEQEGFNFYYLDETNKQQKDRLAAAQQTFFPTVHAQSIDTTEYTVRPFWRYVGTNAAIDNQVKFEKIDSAVKAYSAVLDNQIKTEQAKMEQMAATVPQTVQPKRKVKADNLFRLNFDTEKLPELRPFTAIKWEFAGRINRMNPNIPMNSWVLDEKWEHLELSQKNYLPKALGGHPGAVTVAIFSPDGKNILTAAGGICKIWDLNGKEVVKLEGHADIVKQAHFSPDGKHILTVAGGALHLWDAKTGEQRQFLGHNPDFIDVGFFAENGTKVVALINGKMRVWDLQGNLLQKDVTISYIPPRLQGEITLVTNFTPPFFSTTVGDRELRMNLNDTLNLSEQELLNRAVALQNTLLLNRNNNWGYLYQNGKQVAIIKGHANTITGAYFSPDKQYLVTLGKDRVAKVWSAKENYRLLSNLREHSTPIEMSQFSPDNNYILTVGNNTKNKELFKNDAVFLWRKKTSTSKLYEMALSVRPEKLSELKDKEGKLSFITEIILEAEDTVGVNIKDNPALAHQARKITDMIAQYSQQMEAKRAEEMERRVTEANILRSFSVNNFGIYNWDKPWEAENSVEVAVKFGAEPLKELVETLSKDATDAEAVKIYWITGARGTVVYKFTQKDLTTPIHVRFVPEYRNQIVLVLKNQKMAVIDAEDLAKYQPEKWRNKQRIALTFEKTYSYTSFSDIISLLKSFVSV